MKVTIELSREELKDAVAAWFVNQPVKYPVDQQVELMWKEGSFIVWREEGESTKEGK